MGGKSSFIHRYNNNLLFGQIANTMAKESEEEDDEEDDDEYEDEDDDDEDADGDIEMEAEPKKFTPSSRKKHADEASIPDSDSGFGTSGASVEDDSESDAVRAAVDD